MQNIGHNMEKIARAVTVIPPSRERFSQRSVLQPQKRRVAAYARVSTDSEEQRTSYEAQVDYYTRYIQDNSAWEFVKVYTDADMPYGLTPKARE